MNRRTWIVVALVSALIVAGVVSYWASTAPDGLEKTSGAAGLMPPENESSPLPAPLKDYKVGGISNEFLSNGLAGIAGTLLVLGIVFGAGRLLARKGQRRVPVRRALDSGS